MSLEILLQIAMLHVLRYDAWSRLAAVMTADHHAQQPYHVSIVQTTQHRHFTLKVEPTTNEQIVNDPQGGVVYSVSGKNETKCFGNISDKTRAILITFDTRFPE